VVRPNYDLPGPTDRVTSSTRPADVRLSIRPVQPFDLAQSIAFLRGFTPCSGDHLYATGTLTTGGFADEAPFVAVVSEEAADDGTLAVDVDWIDDPGDPEAVGAWLRGFLSLDDDLTGLYATARDDPSFAGVVEELHGYHHVRFPTPFEAACWAALSQRTPMAASRRLKRDLVEAAGRVATVDGDEVALFPTPGMVLDAAPAVRDAIDHDRKSRTLLAAAEAFAGEDLAALDDDALRERLADVWGFGEWSAEFVALRGFGRLSGLPRTERRLREAVAELYDLDADEATDADLDRLAAPYGRQRGYWAHYVRVWAFRYSAGD